MLINSREISPEHIQYMTMLDTSKFKTSIKEYQPFEMFLSFFDQLTGRSLLIRIGQETAKELTYLGVYIKLPNGKMVKKKDG